MKSTQKMPDSSPVVAVADRRMLSLPPAPLRVPFGWTAAAITNHTPLHLTFPVDAESCGGIAAGVELGFCVAVERRDTVIVRVSTADGRTVATVDVTCPSVFNLFRIPIDRETFVTMVKSGVVLSRENPGDPLWIFATADPHDAKSGSGPSAYHLPHLVPYTPEERPDSPWPEFARRLASRASVQQFGWMEGCVLDGLEELGRTTGAGVYESAVCEHLNLFRAFEDLVYENPRSAPADGTIYGIEGTLPIAMVARRKPAAFAVDAALAYWRSTTDSDGVIRDGSITAEGCYTIAYPLAVIGATRGDSSLNAAAFRQLEARSEALRLGDDIYLRYLRDASRTFRNWGRAWAWYLLGTVRTMEVTGRDSTPERIVEDFRSAAARALALQDASALWHCYFGEPETGLECSGSAGVAASFAIGARIGVLDKEYHGAAERAAEAIARYLTHDGFLGNCSQSNKGGESLQRSGYRVISQVGMGLLGQLLGAL